MKNNSKMIQSTLSENEKRENKNSNQSFIHSTINIRQKHRVRPVDNSNSSMCQLQSITHFLNFSIQK